MCVLGLLHSVYTYRTPLISQWAWLHSLKDARDGPEVSSTALLQLKGGQGTKPAGDSERSRQWQSMGLMNEVLYRLGWSEILAWYMIRDIYCILWWFILSINIQIVWSWSLDIMMLCWYHLSIWFPSFEPHSNCDHECVQWSIGLIIHSRLTQVTMARPFCSRQMDRDGCSSWPQLELCGLTHLTVS